MCFQNFIRCFTSQPQLSLVVHTRVLRSYLLEHKPHVYITFSCVAFGAWYARNSSTLCVSRKPEFSMERGFVYTFSDSGDGSFGFSYSLIAIAVALLLIRSVVSPRWTSDSYVSSNSLLKKLTGRSGLYRPGILLPLLGLVVCAISALRFPPLGMRPVKNIAAIIMCLGLLFRSLKNQRLVNEDPSTTVSKRSDDLAK